MLVLAHLARNWWAFVLQGVIAILFGVLAFARPGMTLADAVDERPERTGGLMPQRSGGQPPLVSKAYQIETMTIIASRMITGRDLRDTLQNAWTTPAMAS